MDAKPVCIIEYFDGAKQNVIPLFQRPYTWDKSKWKTLWEDILNHCGTDEDNQSHFMSAVVSMPYKSVPVGVNKHLIIDGQQRLTTLALLLCSLRNAFKDAKDDQNVNRLDDFLCNRHYSGPDNLKLLPTQGDRDPYFKIVKGQTENMAQHRMLECCTWFSAQIADAHDPGNGTPLTLEALLNTITHSLQVVMINLGDIDDPYQIFESLNFKGEPLTQADLVRNFVLMKFQAAAGEGGDQERVYQKYWLPLETCIPESDELAEFFRHYASRRGKNVKKPKVYSEIKELFKSAECSEIELEQMLRHGEFYRRLTHPDLEPVPEIKGKLERLSDASVCYPLLLRLFDGFQKRQLDLEDLLECLSVIDSVVLRRAVLQVIRGPLNKLFIALAGDYPSEGALFWLRKQLSGKLRTERWPRDDEFIAGLVNTPIYGAKPARSILEANERDLEGKEPVEMSKMTVEHIMPQTLNAEWRCNLGAEAEDIHKKWLDTIGNLTLTGYNPELSNQVFSAKAKKLAQSTFQMNRKIAEEREWGVEQIRKRAEAIAAAAVKFWPGPE